MGLRNGVDVFREPEEPPEITKVSRRPLSISTFSSQQREGVTGANRANIPSRAGMIHDPHTPANGTSNPRTERGAYSGPHSRPSTSRADFHSINDDLHLPSTAPPGLRTCKSTFTFDRDREGMSSRQALYTPFSTAPEERTYGSLRTRPRDTHPAAGQAGGGAPPTDGRVAFDV